MAHDCGLCSATALIPRLRSWWQEGQKLKNYPCLHNKFKACLDYNIRKKTMGAQDSEEKERGEEKERYRMVAGIDMVGNPRKAGDVGSLRTSGLKGQ